MTKNEKPRFSRPRRVGREARMRFTELKFSTFFFFLPLILPFFKEIFHNFVRLRATDCRTDFSPLRCTRPAPYVNREWRILASLASPQTFRTTALISYEGLFLTVFRGQLECVCGICQTEAARNVAHYISCVFRYDNQKLATYLKTEPPVSNLPTLSSTIVRAF
jgi:hypothetical protein